MSFENYSWTGTFSGRNNTFHHQTSSATIYGLIGLYAVLFLAAVIGNATIIILIRRFKSLRTISNMFLANLAVIDFLNILINIPVYTMSGILMHEIMRGRIMSLSLATTHILLNNLKLMGMLAISGERFLGVSLGLKYNALKKKKKMIVAVIAVVWVLGIAITVPWSRAIFKINLGEAPTYQYRIQSLHKVGKTAAPSVFLTLGIAFVVSSIMTCVSFKKQMKVLYS